MGAFRILFDEPWMLSNYGSAFYSMFVMPRVKVHCLHFYIVELGSVYRRCGLVNAQPVQDVY